MRKTLRKKSKRKYYSNKKYSKKKQFSKKKKSKKKSTIKQKGGSISISILVSFILALVGLGIYNKDKIMNIINNKKNKDLNIELNKNIVLNKTYSSDLDDDDEDEHIKADKEFIDRLQKHLPEKLKSTGLQKHNNPYHEIYKQKEDVDKDEINDDDDEIDSDDDDFDDEYEYKDKDDDVYI